MMERKGNSMVISPKREDLVAVFKELEIKFFKDIGNFAFCPTKEPYWTVVSDGYKAEGSTARLFNSEKEAVEAWNFSVKRIVGEIECKLGDKLTIYWRGLPEMRFFGEPDGEYGRWTVYSRFRISAMPVVQSADYNKVQPVRDKYLSDAKQA